MQNRKAEEYWKTFSKRNDFPDPFDKTNKARNVEWEKIYDTFDIKPSKNLNIVELGCGTGHFTLNFLKKGFSITGIDVVKDTLEVLKYRAKLYNLSNKLSVLENGLYSPIKNLQGKFDAAYMISTYHCISNDSDTQKRVLNNFVRLIKPGGKLFIMEPNPLNPLYYIFYPFVYKNNWREGYNIINSRKGLIIKHLKLMGIENIKVYHHSFLPTSFINKVEIVKEVNKFLCELPIIKNFSAFNIIIAIKNEK